MFMENLKDTINDAPSVTENGAVGYRTSGKNLLDINFAVTSMRSMSKDQIIDKFVKAFYEDKELAVKWLFYARDAREGVGERRLFRICFKYLAENHMDIAKATINLVAEYGRWDDLLCLLDSELVDDVVALFKKKLMEDMDNATNEKPCSLLAKWLPSQNTSSAETKRLAKILSKRLNSG